MPKALRNATCKDLFDFVKQKDATCDVHKAAMGPLLTTRRKSKTACEKLWDRKWSTNHCEHIQMRHHATAKCAKEKPDVELFIENVHPSVRKITK